MRSVLSCFLRHDQGAVTLDWVALSGGLLLLAASLLSSLSGPAAGSLLAVLARTVPPVAEAPAGSPTLAWETRQLTTSQHKGVQRAEAGKAERDLRTGHWQDTGPTIRQDALRAASPAGARAQPAMTDVRGPGESDFANPAERIASGAPVPSQR